MELKVENLSAGSFEEFGTVLDPYNCGDPINPGTPIEYFNDRMPLTFAGGSLVSLSVQFIHPRPFKFDFTEAHDSTEELFGGFNTDLIFHVGPATPKPDYLKFKIFNLPKYQWIRVKKGVYHECPFISGDEKEAIGWVILPPYTAFNDTREYQIGDPIKIKV